MGGDSGLESFLVQGERGYGNLEICLEVVKKDEQSNGEIANMQYTREELPENDGLRELSKGVYANTQNPTNSYPSIFERTPSTLRLRHAADPS